MIAHGLTRRKGGARVTLDDFARWRELVAQGAASTLPTVAVDAMTDPDGVTGVVDLSFELEGNRFGRPVTTTMLGGFGTTLLDTANMDLADLGDGRRRASQNVAVADASYADLSAVWPAAGVAPASDSYPVGPASGSYGLARPISQPRPTSTGAVPAGNYLLVDSVGANPQSQTGIDSTDPGRLAPAGEGLVFKVTAPSANTWILYPPNPSNALGSYHLGPDGKRTFTVVLKLLASVAAQVTMSLYAVVGGTPTVTTMPGSTKPLAAGAGPFVRFTAQVTVSGTPGALITNVCPYVSLVTTGATRFEFADMQVYVGDARSDAAGTNLGHPFTVLGYEQQFTGTRRFNRLEVIGHEGSIPTAVYVEQWDGAAWVPLAVGSSTITFPTTITTTGLRVYVEECVGYGGSLLLTEIDATLVSYLDGDAGVVSASVDWSREADPAQVTSPFGNYQAGQLDLELDNSANLWSPEVNANLDVGHRITCAFGVRYTNLLPNPRAEIGVTGWARDTTAAAGVYDRTTDPVDLTDAAPGEVGTAHRITVAGSTASLTRVYSDPIPCAPGDQYDLAGWVRQVLADPSAAGITTIALTFHSSFTTLSGAVLQRTNAAIASAGSSGTKWAAGATGTVTAPASTVAVRVELSCSPQASPGMVALATRMRLRKIESGAPVVWETLVPAGVFYSDPFDWSSDAETVQITATDRLGRNSSVAMSEGVRISQTVGGIVTDLGLQLLDLGPDQIAVSSAVAGYAIPYSTPANDAGSYFADLAKCVAGSLYMDALERLVLERRDNVSTGALAHEIRGDNALIRYQRPAGYDLTTASVKVNAAPLKPAAAPVEVWAMPSGGFQVPATSSKTIVADFSTSPVVAASLSGIVVDLVSYTITPTFYSDRAEIVVTNPNGTTLTVADLRVNGTPLAEQALATVATDAASAKRYGNRLLEVDARLVQTQSQLETVASVLLDSFKALDVNGNRRLPDLILDSMGLLHLEAGDRVLVKNPRTGLGEPFAILGRTLAYGGSGEILSTGCRVRQSPDVTFAISDVHLADDIAVAGA